MNADSTRDQLTATITGTTPADQSATITFNGLTITVYRTDNGDETNPQPTGKVVVDIDADDTLPGDIDQLRVYVNDGMVADLNTITWHPIAS